MTVSLKFGHLRVEIQASDQGDHSARGSSVRNDLALMRHLRRQNPARVPLEAATHSHLHFRHLALSRAMAGSEKVLPHPHPIVLKLKANQIIREGRTRTLAQQHLKTRCTSISVQISRVSMLLLSVELSGRIAKEGRTVTLTLQLPMISAVLLQTAVSPSLPNLQAMDGLSAPAAQELVRALTLPHLVHLRTPLNFILVSESSPPAQGRRRPPPLSRPALHRERMVPTHLPVPLHGEQAFHGKQGGLKQIPLEHPLAGSSLTLSDRRIGLCPIQGHLTRQAPDMRSPHLQLIAPRAQASPILLSHRSQSNQLPRISQRPNLTIGHSI